MDDLIFDSLDELHQRVIPALEAKTQSLRRFNILHIDENDIWEYLKKHVWPKKINLTLEGAVNDILSLSNDELENFKILRKPRAKKEDLL